MLMELPDFSSGDARTSDFDTTASEGEDGAPRGQTHNHTDDEYSGVSEGNENIYLAAVEDVSVPPQ
jgi:hypothetical protein